MPPSALGVAASVDPGDHVIEVENADGSKTEHRVSLVKGEHRKIELPVAHQSTWFPLAQPEATPAPTPQWPHRSWFYAAGAVAVVGVTVGAIGGDRDARPKNRPSTRTASAPRATRVGKDAADSAQTTGLVSTIAFAVGAVGVGAVIYLVAKDRPAGAPLFAPGSQGQGVALRF